MAETVISGVSGGADFKIATQSYKTVLNRFRVRMDVPQINTTVFNSEPNEEFIAGPTQAFFDVSGIGKEGALPDGPLMPPPQGVALTFQYGTAANEITFTGNFESAEAERVANGVMSITGSGRATGAIVITWNKGS